MTGRECMSSRAWSLKHGLDFSSKDVNAMPSSSSLESKGFTALGGHLGAIYNLNFPFKMWASYLVGDIPTSLPKKRKSVRMIIPY